jgi:hypothetical protein
VLAELNIGESLTARPLIRIQLSWTDTPSLLQTEREPPRARRFAPVDLKWTAGYTYEPLRRRADL